MAVAFDACSNNRGTGTEITIAGHTCAGSDRILFCFVGIDATGNFNPAAAYNGVTMGALVVELFTGRYGAYFVLLNPDAGSHDLVVSGLPSGGEEQAYAVSFNGGTSVDAAQSESVAAGTTSQLTNSSATGDMVVSFIVHNSNAAPTVDSTNDDPAMTIPTNGSIANAAMSSAVAYQAGQTSVVSAWSGLNASKTHYAININAAAGGGGGGNPWYAYAQMRTSVRRAWVQHGLIWTPVAA